MGKRLNPYFNFTNIMGDVAYILARLENGRYFQLRKDIEKGFDEFPYLSRPTMSRALLTLESTIKTRVAEPWRSEILNAIDKIHENGDIPCID
jgi:hypothetical protein